MTLRSRLFVGIVGTVVVSLVVTVVAGALLTRRSLETTALGSLERQVDLIATQRREAPARDVQSELGRFLATDEQRLAILTPAQAGLLLPDAGAASLARDARASGKVSVRGTEFLYAARRSNGEAIVLLRPAASQAASWACSSSAERWLNDVASVATSRGPSTGSGSGCSPAASARLASETRATGRETARARARATNPASAAPTRPARPSPSANGVQSAAWLAAGRSSTIASPSERRAA